MRRWKEMTTTNDKATKIFLEMVSHLSIRVYAVRDRPVMLADWVPYSELLRTGCYLPVPKIHIYMKCTDYEHVVMYRIFTEAERKVLESEPPFISSEKPIQSHKYATVGIWANACSQSTSTQIMMMQQSQTQNVFSTIQSQIQNTCGCNTYSPSKNHLL